MGIATSREQIKDTVLTWGNSVLRRLQIWREIRPTFLKWMNTISPGTKDVSFIAQLE
jgi:hypothetical protein